MQPDTELDTDEARWEVVFAPNDPYSRGFPAMAGDIVAEPGQYIHVLPINDLYPHVLSLHRCWCHPVLDEDGQTVAHNSADGREQYEDNPKSLN